MSEPTKVNITTSDGATLYAMAWNTPLTEEQHYNLMRALGYRVAWARWHQRLWWFVRRLWRKL